MFLLLLGPVGCDWQSTSQPSVLVIAVEGLDSESLSCAELAPDEEPTAFDNFCRESVRFSHAYTTSTMSQASLASVLTGKYPIEHGVRHNGSDYLGESFETNAEIAVKKGYRTALFSGGPAILRKSGLDQGFEFFEDHFEVSLRRIYQPVEENFTSVLAWLDAEASTDPFFTIIYVPDLMFEDFPTKNNLGEERALERNSQLEEINESFSNLVKQLKNIKRWDNTHIILMGMNGRTERYREEELSQLNLHGENTQIALLWKPARRNNESGSEWAIDANVTLADVGKTLFDILGARSVESALPEVTSLKDVLFSPRVSWNKDRSILTESGWAEWRRESGIRYAFRQNHVLYIHDQDPQVYNALIDRFEVQPISSSDPSVADIVFEARKFFKLQQILPWKPLPSSLVEKIRFARDWMAPRQMSDENLDARIGVLYRKRSWDSQVRGWLMQRAIETNDWDLAEKTALENSNADLLYFANQKLKKADSVPFDSCVYLLKFPKEILKNNYKCRDPEFIALLKYLNSNDDDREIMQSEFLKLFFKTELNEWVSRLNFHVGLRWDTNLNIPAEPRMVKILLEMDQYKPVRSLIEREYRRRRSGQR